jgi:predicted nucleic acid-binding protein
VSARLSLHAGNFAASVISLDELRFGAMIHAVDSGKIWTKIETIIVPLVRWTEVDQAIAIKGADIRAFLRRKGRTAHTGDCLIAATALVHNWLLVTRNTAHFSAVPGLQIENWFQ